MADRNLLTSLTNFIPVVLVRVFIVLLAFVLKSFFVLTFSYVSYSYSESRTIEGTPNLESRRRKAESHILYLSGWGRSAAGTQLIDYSES
ncbi:hypothetical protein Pan54_08210 [Rubinisphaera italica]|uniref:Uncharacterized protein n=1 Tax=Rubinisphaera italica TaxID=2527969 RepID=A0A5C5XBE8_9PLAN|nr:hypothetical protein Pan54_08210 [Rubinisphaera italica]